MYIRAIKSIMQRNDLPGLLYWNVFLNEWFSLFYMLLETEQTIAAVFFSDIGSENGKYILCILINQGPVIHTP